MTVFGSTGGGYIAGMKQVFPVDYEAEVSQRLVEASHANDLKSAAECIADPFVDVNFIGAVSLKLRKTELVLRDEAATEVRFEFEEFRTEVTALFLAAHAGNVTLVRKLLEDNLSYSNYSLVWIISTMILKNQRNQNLFLFLNLSVGANVNQKLFRGYATTAAVREGHIEILEILVNGGATQPACEEALLEASYVGQARSAELLLGSDMIRPHVAVHALVTASCRGFVDVVDTLIKCGVDPNANARVLLMSSKPSLHTNVGCNAIVAAVVVSRQISIVRLLLQAAVRLNFKVKLGAWSWDMATGEEFRVGAGLAEPYCVTWCAVEYFESSGSILRMLLQNLSPNVPHLGRTVIHHAVLCNNTKGSRCSSELSKKIVLSFWHRQVLILGFVNAAGQCAKSIAGSTQWTHGFQQAVLDVIQGGRIAYSSNPSVFSPLMFVTRANDIETLKKLVERSEIDLDEQDGNELSAAMLAAAAGHVEAFRLLVFAGADINLRNKYGETAITLSEANKNSDIYEKVILEYAIAKGSHNSAGFYALHRAAHRGDIESVRVLMRRGYDLNAFDGDGYTPLMCDIETARLETALKLTRKNGVGNDAECVILDELARKLVLGGAFVKKHTKAGKGCSHRKTLKMVGAAGLLRWGKSCKRNVICKGAEVGPSLAFRWNRRKKFDTDEPGMFRVVTTQNKEVHFVCDGGIEMARLWVRGIKLVTR
ncbi:hypothetical protein Acr_07g0017370 [Actinidia rufa]|uniref:Ankyrin repeat family protein n=1 Tax=Actinidia rufa TaxID=165716 RepID=A0A7J0EYM3_9ERIC|nr:hypothetical protein Acr_07g0017370 [Actinidia rufa]